MPDTAQKRPWWRVKRLWGGIIGGVGTTLIAIPGSPVLFVIGAIPITTTVAGILAGAIATNVFAYGQGAADERNKAQK